MNVIGTVNRILPDVKQSGKLSQLLLMVILCMSSFSVRATHYINKTSRELIITNVTEQNRQQNQASKKKRRTWWNWNNRKYNKDYSYKHTQKEASVMADVEQNRAVVYAEPEQIVRAEENLQEQKLYVLSLQEGQEGNLDNGQGDEITITSPGMSDKRKLFPTNNSFNYVITINKYHKKFEKFDINHAE